MCLKKSILLIFLILFLFSFNSYADGPNIIQNPGFEESSGTNINLWSNWAYRNEQGITTYQLDETQAHSGKNSALIQSNSDNDARFVQIIKVNPDTNYKISCWVKTEGIADKGIGANISIQNLSSRSRDIKGTSDAWEYLEFYGKTSSTQETLNLTICLGGHGGESNGKAWFDDVSVIQVDKVPDGIGINDLFLRTTFEDNKSNSDSTLSIIIIISGVIAFFILLAFILYKKKKKKNIEVTEDKKFKFLSPLDWQIMIAMTVIYFIVALYNLGSTKVPQTQWKPFSAGEYVVLDAGKKVDISRVYFYLAWGSGKFRVEYFDDTKNSYVPLTTQDKKDGDYYVWKISTTNISASKFKVVADSSGGVLNEIAFFEGLNKTPVKLKIIENTAKDYKEYSGKHIIDEQEYIDYSPSFMTQTYFDEIYHARTAYEHYNKMEPYETTHPPLGKVMMMLGLYLFGMTPFGWRIVGTMFGVFMLPAMYLMGKKIFGKTLYAFIACFLMMFDFMHFTQTRIATIDSYGTFFVILMYYFMYDVFINKSYRQDLFRSLRPLFLSGLCFGLGSASKWIGLYAGGGLALVLLISKGTEIYDYFMEKKKENPENWIRKFWIHSITIPLASCILFFILIPSFVYYLSYIPTMLVPGHSSDINTIWQYQLNMFNYHKQVTDAHPFQSLAFTWPLIIKPMWFYDGANIPAQMHSSIVTMGNPAIWWIGIITFLYSIFSSIKKLDKRVLFLVVAIAFQYVPWFFITRPIFIYHFFSTVPFLILTIVYCIKALMDKYENKTESFSIIKNSTLREILTPSNLSLSVVITYLLVVFILFAMFYPVLSGFLVTDTYVDTYLKFDKYIFFLKQAFWGKITVNAGWIF